MKGRWQRSEAKLNTSRHIEAEIPPELDDYIIRFLGDDSISLRSCALVCRAWLVPSQRLLFYEVTIGSQQQYENFAEVITNSTFLQECVHILRIDRSKYLYSLNYPWINTKLAPALSSLLTNLHTFELVKVDERWRRETFTHLSKLKSLRSSQRVSVYPWNFLTKITAHPLRR